jgi:hypothetical protein
MQGDIGEDSTNPSYRLILLMEEIQEGSIEVSSRIVFFLVGY